MCFSRPAVTPDHQRGAPKEEFFITDVAYCEQAVIFLKQAKLPQNNTQRRKEDGTLPVSIQTPYTLLLIRLIYTEILQSSNYLFWGSQECISQWSWLWRTFELKLLFTSASFWTKILSIHVWAL